LSLRQRCGHAQDGLVDKERGAFGDGMDVTAETEVGEIVEEVVFEPAGAFKPIDFGRGEAKILKKIKRLMQPGGEQKSAPRRQRTDKQFEHCRVSIAMIQIGLDHVDLIKVGQERTGCGVQ